MYAYGNAKQYTHMHTHAHTQRQKQPLKMQHYPQPSSTLTPFLLCIHKGHKFVAHSMVFIVS